jgi:hypothetical protein
MRINGGSKKNLLFAALIGASFFYAVNYFTADDSDQNQKMLSMENRIENLEGSLEKKERELELLRMLALRQNDKNGLANINTVAEVCKLAEENQLGQSDDEETMVDATPANLQTLKDFETDLFNEPSSFIEKFNQLLSGAPTKGKIAVASKAIFDMADDRENLPDYALHSIYSNQSDPDLKRVTAQVLSLRGDNVLLDDQIADAQARLRSEQPSDRQDALQSLARTNNSKAVNAIAPLLHDSDTDVKLEALTALSATGNQTHVGLVEMLLKDPDPAVSSLASNVISHLKNLSDSARTSLSSEDIAAELPQMENP